MKKAIYSISERFEKVFALLSEDSNYIGCFSFVDDCPCTIFELSDISTYQLKKLINLKVCFTIFGEAHAKTNERGCCVVQLWFSFSKV